MITFTPFEGNKELLDCLNEITFLQTGERGMSIVQGNLTH